ncbi:MAG: hypothetical protein U0074_08530 [Kouleothrix sp.]
MDCAQRGLSQIIEQQARNRTWHGPDHTARTAAHRLSAGNRAAHKLEPVAPEVDDDCDERADMRATSKVRPGSGQPKNRRRQDEVGEDEIGRNSPSPCTRPRSLPYYTQMAVAPTLSVLPDEHEHCCRQTKCV